MATWSFSYIFFISVVFCCSMHACQSKTKVIATTIETNSLQLYPYLGSNGLYGYADTAMRLVVSPCYITANKFTHTGFAVVQDTTLQYGVINTLGNIVVPIKYKHIYLQELDNYTLMWTEETYTTRWRFWNWRFLPGLSLMGSSKNDNRLFDTKVNMSKLKITIIENKQAIYDNEVQTSESYRYHMEVNNLGDGYFLHKRKLYQLNDGKAKVISNHIENVIGYDQLFQVNGNNYYITDRNNRKTDGRIFRKKDSLIYTVKGESHAIKLHKDDYLYQNIAQVFEDTEGKQYLFPEMKTAFPQSVETLIDDHILADSVLQQAMLLAPIAGTNCFLVRSFDQITGQIKHKVLQSDGRWVSQPSGEHNFTLRYPTGDIVWPELSTVINPNALKDFRAIAYEDVSENMHWLIITLKRGDHQRQGLWNKQENRWIWNPDNYSIRCLDAEKGLWSFRPEREKAYGIYRPKTGEVLITPTYFDINSDGMVTLQENGQYIRFYVDFESLQEYRDKIRK